MNTRRLWMTCLTAALLQTSSAWAAQAGWQTLELPSAGPANAGSTSATATAPQPGAARATTVALYYPTDAPERAMPMGPFAPQVAPYGPPLAQVKGLLLLSHGTGGSELGHSRLATALARQGYLVAALRHQGDNWQDRSLLTQQANVYFDTRPRQASAVISALLAHPDWRDRIARDARGPRVGALGHSAGGYTVMALAGAEPDMALLARHCAEHQAEDAVFCRMGGGPKDRPSTVGASRPAPPVPALKDARVRAVAAFAPVGALLSPGSLASLSVPVALYEAGQDAFLNPRFHSGWIARHMPGAVQHVAPRAGHFASMDPPNMPLPTEGGDVGADPAGFDRGAYLTEAGHSLASFFDQAWR